MKLKDIISNLDMSENNRCDSITWDMEHFLYDLGLSCWGVQQDREDPQLKSYWVATHYCTDSYVGIRAYFLNEVFVALSTQPARKSDENIEWVSKESQYLVRDYILSLEEGEAFKPSEKFIDMEEDCGEGYPIQYVGQCLDKFVIYKGNTVEVVKQDSNDYENFHTIIIKELDTSNLVEIDIRNILVPWYIKKGE